MYTYMEDALDYLTDYASKHHIRIMWASLSPITPPGSNFEYRSVVMNSNWHNPKEFIFQLAHEISHVIHVKVTNKYTNEIIFEGDQSFNMEKEGKKPEGYENVNTGIAELGIPLSMDPDEIKGVNTLNIEVTIEGNKQTIQLFLAGDVNG